MGGHLIESCQSHDITTTRSRPDGGDSPYLEEKNNLVTLKFVGYDCYDSQEKVDLLNRL